MFSLKQLKQNKTLINGGMFSVYSFINQGSSFLLLIILAKFILPEDYGRLSLYNTVLMFLGYFIAFSASGFVSISYFKKDNQEFKKDFTAILILSVITLIFFLLVAETFCLLKIIDFGFPLYLLRYAVLTSFTMCVVEIFLNYFRVQEKVVRYGIVSCGNAILNFIISLLLVISLGKGWIGRVEAQFMCFAIFSILGLLYFKKEKLFDFRIPKQYFKVILLWGIPLIPHHASAWLRQGCDRYIVSYYHSMTDVGLFSFALNMVSVIIMIGIAFNQTNSVQIYKILSDDIPPRTKLVKLGKQTRTLVAIYLFSSLLILFLMSLAIPLVMPKYAGAVPFFVVLCIYGFLQCIYFLYCNYLFYYEKTNVLMMITFFSSLLHLILSFCFTRYSIYGTCFVYILTQLLIVILVYSFSKRLLYANLRFKI